MNIRHGKASEQFGLWGLGITIVALIILAFFFDMESVRAWVANAGPFAPLIFILLKASTVIIAPLSGGPLYPLVGLFFGFWPGFLYVLIGDFIGYTGSFFLARKFGYPLVSRIIAGNERGLLARIVNHIGTPKGMFHMCLTCFAMPELISYGAGLSRLPYPIFIGMLLPLSAIVSATLVFFGASLDLSEGSVLMTIGLPIVAGAVIVVGAWLFLRGVRNEV
ncbi:MAG TPA: VTT domain-containing protein [Candidatus Paceibacterota bacterium]|nr:VTT domain-containing protein [Candidatus Paceibacterota bacterium]